MEDNPEYKMMPLKNPRRLYTKADDPEFKMAPPQRAAVYNFKNII